LKAPASRSGEHLDRFVGMKVGGFEAALGSVLGLGLMMKARHAATGYGL
jgi:hypothetical protein